MTKYKLTIPAFSGETLLEAALVKNHDHGKG